MRCSKACYLCVFELADLFDNAVIEQAEYIIFAGVVELVDTRDLKSLDWKRSYEFKSRLRHVLVSQTLSVMVFCTIELQHHSVLLPVASLKTVSFFTLNFFSHFSSIIWHIRNRRNFTILYNNLHKISRFFRKTPLLYPIILKR